MKALSLTHNNVYLSLGSNLGERESNLLSAIERLAGFCEVVRVSPLYETEPVEYSNQPWFLNCVAAVKTALPPEELLAQILAVELAMGRRRDFQKGPRIIDIDILLYGKRIVKQPKLSIPHPAMHLRRFVLTPLVEIAPRAFHPVLRMRARALLRGLHDAATVRKVDFTRK